MKHDQFISNSKIKGAKWIKTCRTPVNDILARQVYDVRSLLFVVKDDYQTHYTQEFKLILELLLLMTCTFQSEFETAMEEFARLKTNKSYDRWLRITLQKAACITNTLKN